MMSENVPLLNILNEDFYGKRLLVYSTYRINDEALRILDDVFNIAKPCCVYVLSRSGIGDLVDMLGNKYDIPVEIIRLSNFKEEVEHIKRHVDYTVMFPSNGKREREWCSVIEKRIEQSFIFETV